MKKSVKQLLFLIGMSVLGFNALAQDIKESAAYKQEKSVYQIAMKFADVNIARNALYNLIALDPNDVSLLDSLAYMYFDYQRHTSCLLVCLDILKKYPDHLPVLEMSAISYENLGLKDKALSAYESLYLKQNSVFTLYKVAVLQLDLDRQMECMTNVDILLEKEETNDVKISFNTEQGPKDISLKAAVYNLKGLIESRQDQKEAAKASFQEALALEPDFNMAKNNLQDLDK